MFTDRPHAIGFAHLRGQGDVALGMIRARQALGGREQHRAVTRGRRAVIPAVMPRDARVVRPSARSRGPQVAPNKQRGENKHVFHLRASLPYLQGAQKACLPDCSRERPSTTWTESRTEGHAGYTQRISALPSLCPEGASFSRTTVCVTLHAPWGLSQRPRPKAFLAVYPFPSPKQARAPPICYTSGVLQGTER